MTTSFFGSEALRKSFTNHMDHALHAIISSSNSHEQHFQGWHVENVMALCGSFPSSGILRLRLVLSLIILRHCVVPPDSFEPLEEQVTEPTKDGALPWGQPLGLFDSDDWEESYNNFIELQSLLEKRDVTVLHPITRIRLRKQESSNTSGIENVDTNAAPTWIIPPDMEMSLDKNPSSENDLWTEALRVEVQDILLSTRIMQALSIYVRQYIYIDDEEEVEKTQLEKYFNFLMQKFQAHENLKSLLLSMLQSPQTMAPKSRNDVRDIVTQNPEFFNLKLFQKKLNDFIQKVNNLLPIPGFMVEPKTSSQNLVKEAVNQQQGPEKEMEIENEQKLSSTPSLDRQKVTNTTKDMEIKDTNDLSGKPNDDYEGCEDFQSAHSRMEGVKRSDNLHTQPLQSSSYIVDETQNVEDKDPIESKDKPDALNMATGTATASTDGMDISINNLYTQPFFSSADNDDDSEDADEKDQKKGSDAPAALAGAAASATQEPTDDMESSLQDLKVKRSQLKNQVSEDPKEKSLAIASQARIRLKRDTDDRLSDSEDDDSDSPKDKKSTKGAQEAQDHHDATPRAVEPRNDENKNQRNQKKQNDGQSTMYTGKRSRSQVQWDEEEDENVTDEGETPTKKIKLEKIEHKARKRPEKFTEEEKTAIKNGVNEYGESNWAKIKNDIRYKEILSNRTSVQIKDAYRTMKKNNQV